MFKAFDFFPKVVERETKMERDAEKESVTRVRHPIDKRVNSSQPYFIKHSA